MAPSHTSDASVLYRNSWPWRDGVCYGQRLGMGPIRYLPAGRRRGSQHVYNGGVAVLSSTQSKAARVVSCEQALLSMACENCNTFDCFGTSGILGFDFQNGQLIPLAGSPYPYGNGGDRVIC